MGLEVGAVDEAFVATLQRACEGALASMDAHVGLEMRAPGEAFVATLPRACEGALASMDARSLCSW